MYEEEPSDPTFLEADGYENSLRFVRPALNLVVKRRSRNWNDISMSKYLDAFYPSIHRKYK
jgi:hypothetical protein